MKCYALVSNPTTPNNLIHNSADAIINSVLNWGIILSRNLLFVMCQTYYKASLNEIK